MSLPLPDGQYKRHLLVAAPRQGAAVLVCVALLLTLSPALADGVRVTDAWARANAPGVAKAAVYLTLVNESTREARLVGVASSAAERVQLHRTIESDGQSRMEHQGDGVTIPARGERRFEPGGFHIMLMGLRRDLEAGGELALTLELADGGGVRLDVSVKPLTWSPASE